jgi:predicted transposase/invertase (TIGR01784 family)
MQFWTFGDKIEEDKMSAMLQDVPEVQRAYEEFKRFKADPVMREKVKARQRFLDEQQLLLGGAHAEGKAEGLAEGEMKGKIETATMMKKEGFDLAVIARMTGLPPSEIERLG